MHSLLFAALILLQARAEIVPAPEQPTPKPFVAPYQAMPEPPSLPKVDAKSCPFEGCQFGKWRAREPISVYSTWKAGRTKIAVVTKGEEVTALTGITLTLQPGKGVFSRNQPMYGAKKGDLLYSYQNCGEGAEDFWVEGRFIRCMDPNFSWKPGQGCVMDCNGRYLSLPKSEWWVEVRLESNETGWVLVNGNFDGTDALAKSAMPTPLITLFKNAFTMS